MYFFQVNLRLMYPSTKFDLCQIFDFQFFFLERESGFCNKNQLGFFYFYIWNLYSFINSQVGLN